MGRVQEISDAVVEFFQELGRRGRVAVAESLTQRQQLVAGCWHPLGSCPQDPDACAVNSTVGFARMPGQSKGKITRRG
jgi:hypothetical protein